MANAPLSVGAYGADVSRLQEGLLGRGIELPTAEAQRRFFGPATRQALRQFQTVQGLAITGVVDAATAAALFALAPKPATHRPESNAAVATDVRLSAANVAVTKGYNHKFNQIVAAAGIPPPPASVANYLPFRITGDQLLLSGQAPFFGSTVKYLGKVGDSVSIEDARAAARLAGINLLYVAQAALGTLDRVRNVLTLEGMVNCTPAFTQPSAVIDACSDLMVEVFGSDHGKHVRSAVGQVSLPFDITVEIKVSFEIDAPAAHRSEGGFTEGDQTEIGSAESGSAQSGIAEGGSAQSGIAEGGNAERSRTVAELLLDYLALEGATKIFGVPGGALVFILDELKQRREQFDFFVCRHETGAAYIAHGYASVTGELGVVLATTGPSATNALTGAMNAQTSNCALLTITGEVPQQYFGESYLQEGADARLDVGVIFRNAVEYSAVVSSEKNFATLFKQALRVARSQPPRAAHISLPNDIAGLRVTSDGADRPSFPNEPGAYRAVPSGTDARLVQLTFRELAAATRPLIFLGNGARQALADPERLQRFTEFVERFAFPVMTTPDAKGIFPESHPLSLRNYGMCACTWPALYMGAATEPDHYDALLVLGSSLGELATTVVATDPFCTALIPTHTLVQVDLDQGVIGRTFAITRGIVADVGATLDALCDACQAQRPDATTAAQRWRRVAEIKAAHSPFANPQGRASQACPLHPAALVRVINDVVADGHIFVDAGNCVGWSLNNLVVDAPVRFHSALGMGAMGFGVGAVIGGKIGAPGQTCLALVGDGAFLMHGAEVSTAAQHGVGAIWVVLQDDDLSMVSQGMGELFPPSASWKQYYKLGAPDLVKFAEGLGAQAVAITRAQGPAAFAAALQTALRQAQGKRPQVIVVNIDTAAMPPYGWSSASAHVAART